MMAVEFRRVTNRVVERVEIQGSTGDPPRLVIYVMFGCARIQHTTQQQQQQQQNTLSRHRHLASK